MVIYGKVFQKRIQNMGIEEVKTAPQSPWQNPYCERVIGSIRRDCLNHTIVLNEKHLKGILSEYFEYYHHDRTHLGLLKDTAIRTSGTARTRKWETDRPSSGWRASPSLCLERGCLIFSAKEAIYSR